mgnify:CR=1 FL=1
MNRFKQFKRSAIAELRKVTEKDIVALCVAVPAALGAGFYQIFKALELGFYELIKLIWL